MFLRGVTARVHALGGRAVARARLAAEAGLVEACAVTHAASLCAWGQFHYCLLLTMQPMFSTSLKPFSPHVHMHAYCTVQCSFLF